MQHYLSVTAFRIPQKRFNAGLEFVADIYDYLQQHLGPAFRVVNVGCPPGQ